MDSDTIFIILALYATTVDLNENNRDKIEVNKMFIFITLKRILCRQRLSKANASPYYSVLVQVGVRFICPENSVPD